MAVTLLGIMPGYPKADKFSLTGRAYVCQWLVQSDTYEDGPFVVQACSGLPTAFSVYNIGNDNDPYARLREWNAWRQEENSLTWICEARYSTPEPKGGENRGTGQGTHSDSGASPTNPLLELPVAKTSPIEREIPITRVFNLQTGQYNPPMSSSCQPFNPPAMRKTYDLQLTISRNEAVSANHPGLGIQYAGVTNADYFWNMPPGTWICKAINAENQVKQIQGGTEYAYMRVEYVFQARNEGWQLYLLDYSDYYCPGGAGSGANASGYSGYDSGSGKQNPSNCNCPTKVAFLTQQGTPRKGLLNGAGDKLPEGADPVYMVLTPYNSLPYAYLGLPSGFSGCQ